MRLILASSSPRRKMLLRQICPDFDIIQPRVDEARHADEAPLRYARRLSREKAEAVRAAVNHADALILAADTVVLLPRQGSDADTGDLLGKPLDAADARRMLRLLRDRAHLVFTAFTLLKTASAPPPFTSHARTAVTMRDYSDAEIDAYINSGDPFDKAGAYAIQNETFRPVARIDGSFSNVVGLPLEETRDALRQLGFPVR